MKKLSALVIIFTTILFGQFVPNYSVGISDDATSQILNSAGLGISRGFNLLFLAPTDFTKLDSSQNDFSMFLQAGRTGFGFTYQKLGRNLFHWGSGKHVWRGIYLGSTSHFSKDGFEATDFGVLYRGFPWFSAGLNWKNQWARKHGGKRASQELGLGVAFRPICNRLTLAYDHRVSFEAQTLFGNGTDLGGIAQILIEPIDGLTLFSSYDTETQGIQVGVSVGFGKLGVKTYHNVDKDRKYGSSLVGFQVSKEIRRTVFRKKVPTFIELTFDRPITDSPTSRAFFGPKTITLRELNDKIKEMAKDPSIDGIILKPDMYTAGTGMMEELVQSLKEFKASGKKVFAFIDAAEDAQYALACVADSIFLNSGGILDVDGIAFGIGFWKGLFDKIGVEAQVYRRGDYKTAAEPFTREHLSETSREAYKAVLEDMQSIYSGMIRKGRGWSQEKLNEVYAAALFTPSMALKAGLIDGFYHPDQIEKVAGKEAKIIKSHKQPKQWVYDWDSGAKTKIAIIYAEGPIVPGKSQPSPFGGDKIIGSETTTKAIRKAREDKSVKAIVMRVNSPGGSVLASEDIWREVHRTTHPDSADEKNRKPFIISMANVAGSGGYYIACAADTIVADSSTITGSIGVLSGKISVGGLFQKIGLNVDIVKEQPHAEMFGLHRPFTDEEGQRMQDIVDSYYEQFLDRVAEGRGMTRNEVNEIAQGRIWSGIDAKKIGLVDVLGGLESAIDIAREKAGLEEDAYQLQIYKGVEEMKFEFRAESTSELLSLIEAFDTEVPLSKMLDRAKLINDEKFLYLMEEELIRKD